MTNNAKTAIITGAAQGIGLAISAHLSTVNYNVILLDKQQDKLEEVHKRLQGSTNLRVDEYSVDLSSGTQVKTAFAAIKQHYDSIHVLVNNAGVHQSGAFLDISEQEWDRVLAVNLKSAFLCSQAASRMMISAGIPGRIINLGSISGEVSIGYNSAYATSKAALMQLTRSLSVELAPHNITVNCISPGAVNTKMMQRLFEDPNVKDQNLKRIPLDRLAEPAEIAYLVEFLASENASYITGSKLTIDGGWMAKGL